ncbi:hypothetical protein RF11_05245 [Thelohanellus kitauei]|uniref:Uncharacterized protein n=1 Tax=Thelohanellus kitauei TaxID=669202 RepID=A0A0C2N4Q3_THEKT|nr:hypothetical protein RF11_05245 [Thelohanellus kitauei]
MIPEEKDKKILLDVDHRENQRKLLEYISNAKSRDLSVQMQAVKIFMLHFSPIHYPQADRLFIKNFPSELFEEFNVMCESHGRVDRFEEKKILFFDFQSKFAFYINQTTSYLSTKLVC